MLYTRVFAKCVPVLRDTGVLVVIISDRKHKGTIVWKHQQVGSILKNAGMVLFAHKILVRTPKIDLYRMAFSHVICYRKGKKPRIGTPEFGIDVWGPYQWAHGMPKHRSSFAPEVVKIAVEAFTQPGDLVLDPFCGTGTTQRVALGLGRISVGYEINPRLSRFWRAIPSPDVGRD
jgi:hypothetical protein